MSGRFQNKNLHDAFLESLAQLNPAQKDSVSQIHGPVMTIAGPGTGKTQILAGRIGHILLETDTRPSEILCLTYTDAGTIAMRKRLLRFIGPDAYQVAIHTFHSFCNRVIQENPDEFPKNDLEPVDELERIQILNQLIKILPRHHPLINLKSDDTFLRRNLIEFFNLMKKESLSPEHIHELCAARRAEIHQSDEFRYKRKSGEFQKGDLNPVKIEAVETKLQKLEEAAKLFPVFCDLMISRGYYDFDDMIIWVLELFERKPEILLNYQEQYIYVLVDEFQDTSGSQNRLLQLLCNYWESPNVFVVGDDDQSIYRFQGAEVGNILEFDRKYAPHGLQRIVLTENYRSTQNILDAASTLIQLNDDRLIYAIEGLSKDLTAQNRVDPGKPVDIYYCFNEQHEAAYVASAIRQLLEQGVSGKDIAVIYKKHQQVEQLTTFLLNLNIPIQLRRQTNVLENDICKSVLIILEWIARETDKPFSADDILYRILHLETFGLEPFELGVFSHWANKSGNRKPWRILLQELQSKPEGLPELLVSEKWIRTGKRLENWLSQAQTRSLQGLVDFIQTDLQLLGYIAEHGTFRDLESFNTLFGFIKSASQKNRDLNLSGLMERIALLRVHNIGIPCEIVFFNGNGVNLLTAHASKGLEFEYVFMIGCTQNKWDKNANRNSFPISEIFPKADSMGEVFENRRLFYVAMTRAKKSLSLCVPQYDPKGKELSPSAFIGEMESLRPSLFRKELIQLPDEIMARWLQDSTTTPSSRHAHPSSEWIRNTLENYVLSVTHLNLYLKCPVNFYYSHVIKVPSAKNKHLSFGTAVHRTLDALVKTAPEEDLITEYVLEQFEQELFKERFGFTEEEFARFRELGKQILPGFCLANMHLWKRMPQMRTEIVIDHTVVNHVPVKGQLDVLIENQSDYDVIDYKTGNPDNALKKLKAPGEIPSDSDDHEAIFGGDYWRQLVFYAILIKYSSAFQKPMGTGNMYFVEPDRNKKYQHQTSRISREEMEIVEEQIGQVYQKIIDMRFYPGCGKAECEWCSFHNKYPHWIPEPQTY